MRIGNSSSCEFKMYKNLNTMIVCFCLRDTKELEKHHINHKVSVFWMVIINALCLYFFKTSTYGDA